MLGRFSHLQDKEQPTLLSTASSENVELQKGLDNTLKIIWFQLICSDQNTFP